MPRFKNYVPQGVIPACLLPFKEDLSIDDPAYRQHLRAVAGIAGISAICIDGVSQEAPALTFEEQKRVLDITMEEVGDKIPLVQGVYANGGRDAAKIARMADGGGSSALLVFPPATLIRGGPFRPEMTIHHYEAIAEVTDLPLIVFQYPLSTGQGHALETLIQLKETVPTVMAIKDRCNDVVLHERHIRVLQNLPKPVNVLTTHSAWLMSSLVLGCNGLLSGSGSIIADLQVALWKAVQNNDLARARQINDRIYPLAECFYADPVLDMHTRMKEALVMLGRIPGAAVRLPWVKLSEAELDRIRRALKAARITREGAF
jgi:4-hydroxy-tetrahydrodipicolinate synthase